MLPEVRAKRRRDPWPDERPRGPTHQLRSGGISAVSGGSGVLTDHQ